MKKKKGSPQVQEKTTNGRWQLIKDVRQNWLKVELKISHLEKRYYANNIIVFFGPREEIIPDLFEES